MSGRRSTLTLGAAGAAFGNAVVALVAAKGAPVRKRAPELELRNRGADPNFEGSTGLKPNCEAGSGEPGLDCGKGLSLEGSAARPPIAASRRTVQKHKVAKYRQAPAARLRVTDAPLRLRAALSHGISCSALTAPKR